MRCKDWKKVTIGDLFYVRNGASIPSKSFHDNSDLVNNYEAFKMGHIAVGGGLRTDPKRSYVTRSEKLNKYLLEKDDIVMGMTDMKDRVVILGVPAIIKESDRYLQNQRVASLRKKDKVSFDIQFVYYQMLTPDYLKPLQSRANRGVQVNLTTNHIKDSTIYLPPIETQQKIVRILSALDQKIELNNKQNRIIEEEASILIRKYNNYEKGTTKLKEVMSFDNGFAFKSKDYVNTGKYKVVTIKNVQDGLIDSSSAQFVTNYPKDMRDCHKLSVGDVLLSLTGNVGRVGIVFEENLLLNQRVAKMKPKDKSILPFLYFFFRQSDFKQKLEALAKGTAQLNLSPVETLNEEITYSEQSALDLSNSLKPFFEKIVLNNQNNKTLSCVRDSLLLKLMSGKINLDKVTV